MENIFVYFVFNFFCFLLRRRIFIEISFRDKIFEYVLQTSQHHVILNQSASQFWLKIFTEVTRYY